MNCPTLIISAFGVSAEMINLVFEGSGCLGTLDDLRSGRLRQADPQWLEANYFHPAGDNNWLELLNQLLEVRAAGQLAALPRWRGSLRGRARRRLRLIIPSALWPHIRRLRGCSAESGRQRHDLPARGRFLRTRSAMKRFRLNYAWYPTGCGATANDFCPTPELAVIAVRPARARHSITRSQSSLTAP